MEIANFAKVNTSKIFAIEDTSQLAYARDKVSEALSILASKEDSKYMYYDTEEALVKGGRSSTCTSTSIGVLYAYVEFPGLDEEVAVSLIPKTTNGYYSGFTLDYETQFENSEIECKAADEMVDAIIDSPEDFMDAAFEELYADLDEYDVDAMDALKEKFMDKFDSAGLQSKLQEELDELVAIVEEIYEKLAIKIVPEGEDNGNK